MKNDSTNKYQIALNSHIVGGSARAYLEKIGLIEGNVASQIVDEWQMPDGIDSLHKIMQDYYDNDRFEVLRQRAEKTLADTQNILQSLLERHGTSEFKVDAAATEIIQIIQSRLPKFQEKSHEITVAYTQQIVMEEPFTTALQADINNIYPRVNDENGHQNLIEKTEFSLAMDIDVIYPTTTVDGKVRNKLSKDFVENIVKSVAMLTVERQKNLREKLIDSFLEIMGIETATTYKVELRDSVDKLFDKMLIEGGASCSFNSLVERFVTTPIQTLILAPFAADERRNKVRATLLEFLSLSVYYNLPAKNAQDNIRANDLSRNVFEFFAKILAHEGVKATSANTKTNTSASDNEHYLQKFFEEVTYELCDGTEFFVDSLPISNWANFLTNSGVDLQKIATDDGIWDDARLDVKIRKLFKTKRWKSFSAEMRRNAIRDVIKEYPDTIKTYINSSGKVNRQTNTNFSPPTNDNETFTRYFEELHERAQKVKRMNSKDNMIATLDTDIEILRDITSKSVLKAIGLERAFISVVTKNVELIREHLGDSGEGGKAFIDWVRLNAQKLMPSKFASIIENREINERRRAIVNSIKNVLKSL